MVQKYMNTYIAFGLAVWRLTYNQQWVDQKRQTRLTADVNVEYCPVSVGFSEQQLPADHRHMAQKYTKTPSASTNVSVLVRVQVLVLVLTL